MDIAARQESRIEKALQVWADTHGVKLSPNAVKDLAALVHTQVDIHRSEALSLAHEAMPDFRVNQVVGRKCP